LYVGQPRVELFGAQLTQPLGAVVLAGGMVRVGDRLASMIAI
jgi:hypothetical protein